MSNRFTYVLGLIGLLVFSTSPRCVLSPLLQIRSGRSCTAAGVVRTRAQKARGTVVNDGPSPLLQLAVAENHLESPIRCEGVWRFAEVWRRRRKRKKDGRLKKKKKKNREKANRARKIRAPTTDTHSAVFYAPRRRQLRRKQRR